MTPLSIKLHNAHLLNIYWHQQSKQYHRFFSDYFSTSTLTSSSYFSSQTSAVSGRNGIIFDGLDTSGLTGHARRSMIRSNGQRHSDQRHSVSVQSGR